MLRLQAPLPDRYTLASPDELDELDRAPPRHAARRPAARPRPPLPARRGHPVGRHARRLVQARPVRRGQRPGHRHRVLRRALHGRVGRRAHRRPPAGRSSPTSTPAARWPTWPTSTRSRSAGTRSRRSPTSTGSCPITYMNSSAALKAFVGEHGGAVCTSSNARAVLEWALAKGAPGDDQGAVLPRPAPRAQHRATTWATTRRDMRVWNPRFELGGLEERDVKERTFLLWQGHCSVHQRFRPEHVDAVPRRVPGRRGHRAPRVRARRRRARRPGRVDRADPRVGRAAPSPGRCSASAPRSTWCSAWPPSIPT